MSAADLLARLRDAGLTLTAEEGSLRVGPASALTDEMGMLIREQKPALLILLAQEAEAKQLYDRLAAAHGWPPEVWESDREAILGDAENALRCLRHLCAEQGLTRSIHRTTKGNDECRPLKN